MRQPKPTSKKAFLNAIANGKIIPEDGDRVVEFVDRYGTLKNLSKGTINKYLFGLKALLQLLGQREAKLATLTEDDVLWLIQTVREKQDWSETTKADYWDKLTVFYKWIEKRHGPWPGKAKSLLVGEDKFLYKIDPNKVEKKGTLTPEEVIQLIHIEPDLAYKAFFAILYESGMRAGEAFSLHVCDVQKQNGRGYILQVRQSKTTKRPIPLINFSITYLAKWLQLHPDKDNPDAQLFVNTYGHSLTDFAANKHLKYLLKQAGIKKRKVTLHSFRHSRAGELSNLMTEAQLCKFFGWSFGSKMPATYIREEAVDVRGALLKGYGFEEHEAHEIKGRGCLHCEHLNPVHAEYCDNCSLPLDRERLEKIKTDVDALRSQELLKKLLREHRADLILDIKQELRQDPDFQKKFEEYKKNGVRK